MENPDRLSHVNKARYLMKRLIGIVLVWAMVFTLLFTGCKKSGEDTYDEQSTTTPAGVSDGALNSSDGAVSVSGTALDVSGAAVSTVSETDLMGVVDGERYTNAYFGFTINKPASWTDVREMTAKTYEQQGLEYATPVMVIASVDPATNPDSLGIVSLEAYEKKTFTYPINNISEYYTFIKEQMAGMATDDVEVAVSEPVVTPHTKTNVETFTVKLTIKSENVTQTILYIIGETNDYFLLGNFMYTAESDRPGIESVYQSLQFE